MLRQALSSLRVVKHNAFLPLMEQAIERERERERNRKRERERERGGEREREGEGERESERGGAFAARGAARLRDELPGAALAELLMVCYTILQCVMS